MFFIRTIAFYFVTARKRSLRRLCFYTCLSVHRRRVVAQHALQVVSQHALQVSSRVYPSMPCRFPGPHPGGAWGSGWGVSRSTLGGGEVEESGLGGLHSHTRGDLQAHTWGGCIPACTEADPPTWWLLLRAVRILLECILVLLVALFIPILDETFWSLRI